MSSLEIKKLKTWFLDTKRDLPWRENPSPYAVWVSEVMLQQTQVAVVIPYFLRWMERFPTVQVLAEAPLDEVIKMWEGLGYYSRARYLHQGARTVVERFGGQVPNNVEALKEIKGLGDYTIGAILSFAFHQRIPAVDGNVIRVLTRCWNISDDIAKPSVIKKLRELLAQQLPEKESWIANEALIELGATICQKKPKCQACPLNLSCMSYAANVAEQLPYKSTKTRIEALYRIVTVLECRGHLLVSRVEKGKIMSDLHEFPYCETSASGMSESAVAKEVQQRFGIKANEAVPLRKVSHSFTRFRVQLFPYYIPCSEMPDVPGYSWVKRDQIAGLAFSSGHRRVLAQCAQ